MSLTEGKGPSLGHCECVASPPCDLLKCNDAALEIQRGGFHRRALTQDRLSGGGDGKSLRGPVEQCHTETFLKESDTPPHGYVADGQSASGRHRLPVRATARKCRRRLHYWGRLELFWRCFRSRCLEPEFTTKALRFLENIANIRVPVIAAIEGRAHIHSDYALLANVIVAAEDATFQDVGHFAVGVVPGDGIFTTWSYRAGAGRAEAFLLNPRPLAASTAYEWGVVAEVVPNGRTLSRARELAALYLKAPEVTRRYTRIHFIQPLKERIVREVGYGLSLEGASSAALIDQGSKVKLRDRSELDR